MKLRFMTYNIQHGADYRRRISPSKEHFIDLGAAAEVIRELDADVISLNEVRGFGEDPEYTAQAERIAAILGYHCFFAPSLIIPKKGPYGNAIISKFPIIKAERIIIPDPADKTEKGYYETRSILRSSFDACGGFTVLGSHFGLNKSEQKNAVETVLRAVSETEGPLIVAGDFNMRPEDPILAPLFEKLYDTAKVFEKPKFSFPSNAPDRRIDYVLTRGFTVKSADIPESLVSDHRPYVADLEI